MIISSLSVELKGARIIDLDEAFFNSAFWVLTNNYSAKGSVGIYYPPSESYAKHLSFF